MRTIKKVLTLTAMAAALQACGGDNEIGPELVAEPSTAAASTAVFNPAAGASGLPFPVDLLFSGTADGTVNIPGKPNSLSTSAFLAALATPDGGADEGALITAATSTPAGPFLADPQTALNTMDGFSTTAPMVVRFSDDIDDPADPNDIKDNVRIFRLTTADAGANGTLTMDAELTFGVDFVAGVSGGTSMLIQPLRPLEPGRTHVVVIENGLKTTGGNPVGADDTYALLNGAYQLADSNAMAAVAGQSDFVLQADGTTPCDLTSPAGVAACTDVNTEDYQAIVDNVPPAAAGAAQIVAGLTGLETSGAISTLIQLEQLRRITAKHLEATVQDAVSAANVVLSYSITTENVGGALAQAKAQVDGAGTVPDITVLNPITAWDTTIDIEVTSPGPDGDINTTTDYLAHIYLGTLDDTLQFVDPVNPNSSVWEAENASWLGGVVPACAALPAHALGGTKNLVGCNQFTPVAKNSALSVPVLISAPRAEALAGDVGFPDCSSTAYPSGLPVVIYQHGITTSRATLMAIADTLASQCTVGVAIDMPKHGIAPDDATFSALFQLQAALTGSTEGERLVKVSSPMTECQAGSGVAVGGASSDFYCPSGDNFINLTNLANARDSLRQAVVDLHTLYRALNEGAGLAPATIGAAIDTGNIHFAGVSLGSIVGTPFVAQQAGSLSSAVFNVGGGGIAKILDGSPAFEPTITTGLYEAAGLAKPGGDYEGFLIIAQTMVDSMDPINFAEDAAASGTPLLVQEVIGDPSDNIACLVDGVGCPDQVVPNNVFGSSFGSAWGIVAQTGQTSYLANQNFITTPVALAGTDPLAQGTGFVALGAAVQEYAATGGMSGISPATAAGIGPVAFDAGAPATAITFKGMNLPTVTGCGAAGTNGVVRFTSGDHGSMLRPTADPLVTAVMQKQLATFVASGGALIADDTLTVLGGANAGVVFEPAVTSSSTAACAP